MKTQAYYDEFADWYENERGRGYHQLIDDLEVDLVRRYGKGASILEAGCGTGLILERVARFAGEAWGFDLSGGMLAKARERNLHVVQASITHIPFPDQRFDVVYSFKVLSHVHHIREAIAEMARVTRPGGYMLLEFYNTASLRYLVKRLKPPTPISHRTTDQEVFTRYDSLDTVRSYLPADCHLVTMRGVRVVTLTAQLYKLAPVAAVLTRLERKVADLPVLRRLGGFLIAVVQKE